MVNVNQLSVREEAHDRTCRGAARAKTEAVLLARAQRAPVPGITTCIRVESLFACAVVPTQVTRLAFHQAVATTSLLLLTDPLSSTLPPVQPPVERVKAAQLATRF